jgi:aminoglycoside phosphotransferase (APT) family kinase protein
VRSRSCDTCATAAIPSPRCTTSRDPISCSSASPGRRWSRTSPAGRGARGRTRGTLAGLHRRLHAFEPPDLLRGQGRSILHLDLHPLNVILGPRGPVEIDWANAERGEAEFDVALTAVVLAGAPIGPPLSWLRNRFVGAFLGSFADDEWRGGLDRAIAYRAADGNVSERERARLRTLRL